MRQGSRSKDPRGHDMFAKTRSHRQVVLGSALAAIALLGGAKLVTLNAVQEHRPDLLAVLDVVEPWKSSLARGDARFTEGALPAAAARFSEGVQRAPDDGSRCLVRVNLALTQWRQAQIALNGSRSGASGASGASEALPLLARAAATADARAGERCTAADDATLTAVADAVREAQVRTALPGPPATSSSPAAPPADPASAVPSQDQLDAVADEAQQGAAERAAQGDREESAQEGGSSSDTPW